MPIHTRRFNQSAITLGLLALANTARAAAPPPAQPSRQQIEREAEQKLASADPAGVKDALQTLGKLGDEQAAAAITARVRRGLPPQLLEPAIAALVQSGKPNAGPVLLELTLHRRPQIRAQAVAALGALKIRSAQSSLLYALDDPSPEVRVAAVSALGVVGSARALPALFASADRGVDHVFDAIGAIGSPKEVEPLMQRARHADVMLVEPALRAMLARPSFPLQTKLAIVDQVAALGTPSARACLAGWLAAHEKDAQARLPKALRDAVAKLDKVSGTTATAQTALPAPTAASTSPAPPQGVKP